MIKKSEIIRKSWNKYNIGDIIITDDIAKFNNITYDKGTKIEYVGYRKFVAFYSPVYKFPDGTIRHYN